MDVNNDRDYLLAEFVYYATYEIIGHINILKLSNDYDYKMSNFIEELFRLKLISDDTLYNLLSDDINVLSDILNHIYSEYDFSSRKISHDVPKHKKYHILDDIEKEAKMVIDKLVDKYTKYQLSQSYTEYTNPQVYDDFECLIKACNLIEENENLTEEEFCKRLDIIYYNDNEHWPILKQWLLDHNCDEDYIGQIRLRFNAMAAWKMINDNPNVSLESILKELFE